MNQQRVDDRQAILTADHTFPTKVNDCARISPAALAMHPALSHGRVFGTGGHA
jgi:hypothetical protein